MSRPPGPHLAALAALAALALLSCGGSDPTSTPQPPAPPAPRTGAIAVGVVADGEDLDPDGFLLSVDGGTARPLVPGQPVRVDDAAAGAHTLAVSGLAFNCALTTPVSSVAVVAGATTSVSLAVRCTRFLSDAIVYAGTVGSATQLMVMRSDGSRRAQLTNDAFVYAYPAVSPDGRFIAVGSDRGGARDAIYILNADGTGIRTLYQRPGRPVSTPAWSPDGTRLVFRIDFEDARGPYFRLFVINADGTGLRQLTPDPPAFDGFPSWSPDGRRIAFSRSTTLHMINADGTGLTSLGVTGIAPVWSPDGTRLAFHATVDGNTDVYVMRADGTERTRLTTFAGADMSPSWSPDGRSLAFHRFENGAYQIYRVDARGGEAVRLSVPPSFENSPSWSPVP